MSLPRRFFLRLSALGTASLLLPLATTGCGASAVGLAPDLNPGGAGELLFFDAEGRLLQLQPGSHRVLVDAATPGGQPVVLGGFGLGTSQLNGPTSLALGPDGRIYVVDRGNGRVQVYAREGTHLGQLGRAGTGRGELAHPFGACVDAQGRVWVSDTLNHRLQRYDARGQWLDSPGEGVLQAPRGLALAPDGNLHVVEGGSAQVAVFSPEGTLLRRYGGRAEGMFSPRSVVVVPDGSSYVTDVTAAALFVFGVDGRLRERLLLSHAGLPAAPLHAALSPAGVLEIATLPAAAAA